MHDPPSKQGAKPFQSPVGSPPHMKSKAVTLVHKGAMEIAVHAVSSFARHFRETHHLEIHTDGTPDGEDERELARAAVGIEATIMRPDGRKNALAAALDDKPAARALFARGGYFSKLELAVTVPAPFFYFDSDIVWLRPVENLTSEFPTNSFSTESWSWYFGVVRDGVWIREGIPRRVNSGFYSLTTPFPTDRLERMMAEGLYDPKHRYSTDQEIMAFLFPGMNYYHPDDLKRSRRGVLYDLLTDPAAALHFPGRMWKQHLKQILDLKKTEGRSAISVRYLKAVPLTHLELWKMRTMLAIGSSPFLKAPVNALRTLRTAWNAKH